MCVRATGHVLSVCYQWRAASTRTHVRSMQTAIKTADVSHRCFGAADHGREKHQPHRRGVTTLECLLPWCGRAAAHGVH